MTAPQDDAPAPLTIIGVPGLWPTRSDIVVAIAQKSGGYLFAGMILMHVESKRAFKLEIYEPDPALPRAFATAGMGRVPAEQIGQIARHTFCLYLVDEGGTPESALEFMHAANALLACGGLAVKIESAGVAHSAETWAELCADGGPHALIEAYIAYINTGSGFYTCGAHNLGLPDAQIEDDLDANEAVELLRVFTAYQLIDAPQIHDGETFSLNADAQRYRMHLVECTNYEAEEPFHNPYGVWQLRPA